MTKKKDELLLPSAQRHSVFTLAPALSTAMSETHDGEYMLEQAGKRGLRIALETDLTIFAMGQIAALTGNAGRVFSNSCVTLERIAASTQVSPSDEYNAQFQHLLKDQLAEQLLEMHGEAARQMRSELSLPLPSEKPKSEPNLLDRIDRFFFGEE